ncbi:hypothetical protein D3C80_1955510 [compost metagenome]
MAEVEQTIIITRWKANNHVFKHLFYRRRGPGIADKVGTEFAHAGSAKRHVIAQDLYFVTVLIFQCGE